MARWARKSPACSMRGLDPDSLPLVPGEPRIGACVGGIGKFVCIGLNYADHAAESGLPVPAEPVVFAKWTSAVCGPDDGIEIPRDSVKADWEVELGVVIGRECKHVDEASALDYVAGYCVINDVSEREWQIERGGQWDKGKGFDTFGPRRDRGSAAARSVARGRRPSLPERQHANDDLQRGEGDRLSVALHEPAARRRDLHRHAARRRHGREAVARLPQAGADRATRHRRPRRAAAANARGRLRRRHAAAHAARDRFARPSSRPGRRQTAARADRVRPISLTPPNDGITRPGNNGTTRPAPAAAPRSSRFQHFAGAFADIAIFPRHDTGIL
ncbi:hypothetical protein Bpla01_26700 [Burkholderia plantarii]|nr:hypothetical protein Bpla01_26700 [Burkholderia plantarii]